MSSGIYDHSNRIKDRTGIRYGRLIVLKYAGRNDFNQLQWLCKCNCGEEKIITGNKLKNDNEGTRSCGCLQRETIKKIMEKCKGGNHYQYIDGRCYISSKLKEERRKKDNYTCQECNKTQEQSLKEIGEILSVHHIDGDDTNNNLENMITLCRGCHCGTHNERGY